VWAHGVIVLPPPFDENLSLAQGIEDLPVQQFLPELPVEGLAVALLPGASGLVRGDVAL